MAEVVGVSQPATTVCKWLSSLPLAASAGTAISNIYEGSKNYNCVTQYALGTMESSVKLAASAIAPVVKGLDKPIQTVDSYAVSKLVQLEEKVPAVKSQPEEVVAYLSETKDALAGKLVESRTTISTRISDSKDSLTSCLASGKVAVCSKLSSGADSIANSRAGVVVSEGKQAITCRITQGKEALGNTFASGRDAVYTKIQSGVESLANTRAGCLVGSGVDRTLSTTENWVEYLLPEIDNEKELTVECENNKGEELQPCDDSPAEDEESTGRVERICTLSQKVKVRMYLRSMQRLQAMQKNCKSTLEQLKQTVDLLKLAQAARDGMDKRYQTVTSALKDLEEQLKQLLSRQSESAEMKWPSEDDEEEDGVKVEWLDPKPQEGGYMQSSLNYAKQLSEKVFHTFQSVTVVTAYLPSHLKGGATQGYQYAQEMYTTLRPIRSPTDMSASALNRISSLLETQLGYVAQLGNYLTSVLQRHETSQSVEPVVEAPAEDTNGEDGDNESSDSEIEEPVNN